MLPIKLKKGKNALLVKACQNEQEQTWTVEWQFQIRICDSTGTAILAADPRRPPPAGAPADLVFLDPPWGSDLAGLALTGLAAAGWIGPRSLVIVEVATKSAPAWPAGFTVTERRRYGRATLVFLRYDPAASPG